MKVLTITAATQPATRAITITSQSYRSSLVTAPLHPHHP